LLALDDRAPEQDASGHPPEQAPAGSFLGLTALQVGEQLARVARAVDPAPAGLRGGGVRTLCAEPAGEMTAATDGDELAPERPDGRIDDAREPYSLSFLEHEPTSPTKERLDVVGSAAARR
jgi:hypothetical protein